MALRESSSEQPGGPRRVSDFGHPKVEIAKIFQAFQVLKKLVGDAGRSQRNRAQLAVLDYGLSAQRAYPIGDARPSPFPATSRSAPSGTEGRTEKSINATWPLRQRGVRAIDTALGSACIAQIDVAPFSGVEENRRRRIWYGTG